MDWAEVNSLIHHLGLGLSVPHLGISLSTPKMYERWRCLQSLEKLQLCAVLYLTDDFSGESKFHSKNVVLPKQLQGCVSSLKFSCVAELWVICET